MRRARELCPRVASFEALLHAAYRAAKGRRVKGATLRFFYDLERELVALERELREKTYRPGPYITFKVREGKERLISAAPFRDRVVHHALCAAIGPVFERGFIFDLYSNRKGKGTHRAVRRFRDLARRARYVLKCDIRKYFPSIDHEVLLAIVARKIADEDVLWLTRAIVSASNPQEPVLAWFPGDDLFAPIERRRGLPIGNLTSQLFANVYLDPLDHFVTERLRPTGYLRYVDDFLLLANDPAELREARAAIAGFLGRYRLRLHPGKAEVARVADGVDLLGYRVLPMHVRVRKANVHRAKRRLVRLACDLRARHVTPAGAGARVRAWLAHAAHASGARLRGHVLARAGLLARAEARPCGTIDSHIGGGYTQDHE